MIHKKLFTLTLAGLAIALASPALAQDAKQQPAPASAQQNIRVVNIDSVRAQSTAFIAARKQISDYGNTTNQALKKEDIALRDANAELNRKRTLLAPEAFAEERKKFEQRVAAFQRKTQEQQKALNKVQLDTIGKINDKILQIITEYARANNVTLVLPAQSVLLRADAMDMDAHVLQRLNKELPSVKVALPAQ